jgi:hypothetical protein
MVTVERHTTVDTGEYCIKYIKNRIKGLIRCLEYFDYKRKMIIDICINLPVHSLTNVIEF